LISRTNVSHFFPTVNKVLIFCTGHVATDELSSLQRVEVSLNNASQMFRKKAAKVSFNLFVVVVAVAVAAA
jgi:hypothetical protein